MNAGLFDQLKIAADTFQQLKGGGLVLKGQTVSVTLPGPAKRFLYHGWQSWTLTAWADLSWLLPVSRPAVLHPMQTDPAHVHEKRPHGSWFAAAEVEKGGVIFLGSLGLDAHVVLEADSLKGSYDADKGDWFLGMGEADAIFRQYALLLKDRLGGGRIQQAPRVWCSWYTLYTEVSERLLVKILGDLDRAEWPIDVFQVDDGWQKNIGDWEANEKFSAGMDGMAAWVKATDRTAGLWLAPLLAVPSSSLYQEHPEWLLHDHKGKLVSAGFNWGEPLYALDTTHPAVLEWLATLMKRVRAWGYDYVKLDFLYAGALPGKRHEDKPREAAYRDGLRVIREALGDAYLLTCGAPILPSLGLCDGMRVGPDVAGHWELARDRDMLLNYAIPGVQNAIRTSLNRLWLRPLLHTDPDVVYFGTKLNSLTSEQKSMLQDLAQIAGFKAISAVPAWLSSEEQSALKDFLAAGPAVRKVGRYRYRLDERAVDFTPLMDLPPLPTFFQNMWGGLLESFAGLPFLMKIFDQRARQALRKTIEANPV